MANQKPYQTLANAIVLQAVQDYRSALKRLKKNPESDSAKHDVGQLERFFRSGWYQSLTTVDGSYLIRKLREETGQSKSIRGKNIFNRR